MEVCSEREEASCCSQRDRESVDRYQILVAILVAALVGVLIVVLVVPRLASWRLRFSAPATAPLNPPKHVAVIMDGNRRFGKKKFANAIQGHWAGGQTLVDFARWCAELGVSVLTVYAFSTENWNREASEVAALMAIFSKYAQSVKAESLAHNVRVKILSTDIDRLPPQVRHSIADLEAATAACSGFQMNICLSYGARSELVQACREIASEVVRGERGLHEVDENAIESHLTTAGIPDPDILIRTSGEHRLSNFLLWQLSYSELFFIDKYWPEVTRDDLAAILQQYSDRQRRYGL